jgi:putative restriction endonuclease
MGTPAYARCAALSKIHHAAFDNHLIGIDPDGRVHVSERLLMLHDGPLLGQSFKAAAGAMIRLPRAKQYHPDRDRAVQACCLAGCGNRARSAPITASLQ